MGDITNASKDYLAARAVDPTIDDVLQKNGIVPGSKTIAPKW
jgi:hypothetical protein